MTLLLACLVALAGVPEHYQASYDQEASQDYTAALSELDAAEALGERGYVLALRRGWLHYLAGQYADAVAAYQEAIALAPNSIEARNGLLLPLMAQRRWSEVVAACDALLAIAPHDSYALGRRAWGLYQSGRYREAEGAYRTALTDQPSSTDLRAGLGWALLKQGRTSEAASAFELVLRVAPQHATALSGQAEVASGG